MHIFIDLDHCCLFILAGFDIVIVSVSLWELFCFPTKVLKIPV